MFSFHLGNHRHLPLFILFVLSAEIVQQLLLLVFIKLRQLLWVANLRKLKVSSYAG